MPSRALHAACAAIALTVVAACARRDAPPTAKAAASAPPSAAATPRLEPPLAPGAPAPQPRSTQPPLVYVLPPPPREAAPVIPPSPIEPRRGEPSLRWRIESGTPWRVEPENPQLAPMDARPWLLSADPRPAPDCARPQVAILAPPVKRDLGDGKDREPLGGDASGSGSTVIVIKDR